MAEFSEKSETSHQWYWARTPKETEDIYFRDVRFLNNNIGWIVGNQGSVLRTEDGGYTWSKFDLGTRSLLRSVAFQHEGKMGCIVGADGTLRETQNIGKTWEIATIEDIDEELLKGIEFRCASECDSDNAFCVVGTKGTILRGQISNGSFQWGKIPSPSEDDFWSVHFSTNGRVGCIVGYDSTILVSDDGGLSWKLKQSPISDALYSAYVCYNGNRICAIGDEGSILISDDKGDSWKIVSDPCDTIQGDKWLNTCYFSSDDKIGWIVGTQGLMLNTVDGGETWSILRHDKQQELEAIWALNDDAFWVVGENGLILTTLNLPL